MFGRLLSYIKTMGTGSMRKRLYTRLAGGAALLVLTVFAIAQAQRMSASRQAAVAAQREGDHDGLQGDSGGAQLARSPQPIPQVVDDDGNASSLKPPSTLSIADPSSSSPRYSMDDDGYDETSPRVRPPAADGYGYGSSGQSQFSETPRDPVAVGAAGAYADRYASSGSYGSAATGRYADSEERYSASSEGRDGSAPQPTTATFADESDDDPLENDQYANEEASDEPYQDDDSMSAAPVGVPADSPYSYRATNSSVAGSYGSTSSRFSDGGYAQPLSPAAHLEDSERDDSETTTSLEDDESEALDRGDSRTDELSYASGGTSDRGVPATSSLADDDTSEGDSDQGALPNTGIDDKGRRDEALDEKGAGTPSGNARSAESRSREVERNVSGGSSRAGAAASSGVLLGSSASPRELAPPPSHSGPRSVPPGGSSGLISSGSTSDATSPVPGGRDLEGAQTPSVTIEKFAPQEVQVGQSADFEVLVSNVGRTPAHDVVVMDRIPQGTVLNETTPEAEQSGDVIIWRLGTLQPGSEIALKMNVTPQTEGDLGSVAQVAFRAQATARTVSTRPEVVLDVRVADQVLVGDSLSLVIMVRNDGTGAARGVVIEEDVPEGFSHPSGRELENEIGLLRPNETKTLELRLEAQRPGIFRNVVRVRDVGATDLVHEREIEIVAPQLEVDIRGPRIRYVERQATYELSIRNTGTASARRVELLTQLPRGMKFVSANKLGQYDARQHAVYWNLDELPPGKEGTVSLVTLPAAAGEQIIQVEATADLGASDAAELAVRVENLAELSFTISDTADPIEVGADTNYRIEVMNQGGKVDTNILVTATLPDELTPIDADGPTIGNVAGQQVQFDPVPRLAPGERIVFQVQARGQKAGDARVRIQVLSDEAPKPVVKEESTRVYAD